MTARRPDTSKRAVRPRAGFAGMAGVTVLVLACGASPAAAQTPTDGNTTGGQMAGARSADATRVQESPVVDGRLDEEVWQTAPALTGFTQREPVEGATPEDATEIRFVYDEEALYIGARMYGDPSEIRADVTRRDVESNAEQIVISFDTYRDRRTAYTFAVTASGVRIDYFHSTDLEADRDYSFNPVWEAKTNVDVQGWTAEIRIPFTQLRFNRGDALLWGVNVVRARPSQQERSYWALVGREETGWASRMGELRGIAGIAPSHRIELMPYVATSAQMSSGVDPDDPFAEERDASIRVGGDVKMGLGPNLTLDATFNPDFGQVEADPAVVNLSAFEVFFDERRPFFIEGAQLFNVSSLFYSRRIGASPHGSADADYVESLDNTTILGAAKLTGRLPSGLSIGVLGALTDEEEVQTYTEATDDYSETVVEPLTGYGVVRMDQQYGDNGSNIGFILTGVQRTVAEQPNLADILAKTALTGAITGQHRWAGGMYAVDFSVEGSHLRGTEEAMLRQQTSSRRYYQRPDIDYVQLDSTATSFSGYIVSLGHRRNSGTHWLWNISTWAESPGFETNDLGANSIVDALGMYMDLTWRETTPGRFLRNYRATAITAQEINYGGTHWASYLGGNLSGTFANFSSAQVGVDYNPQVLDPRKTRGGPLMKSSGFRGVSAGYSSPSGRNLRWSAYAGGGNDALGGWSYWAEPEITYRPSPSVELSLSPEYSRRLNTRQYIAEVEGGRAQTYGTRYIFSSLDYSELSAQLRLNYALRPDLTLETYAEPFASAGRFYNFGELAQPRDHELLLYGGDGTTFTRDGDGNYVVTAGTDAFTINDPDFRSVSFRSNVVLRWEWRPGSTLFLVWQQDRSGGGLPTRTVRPGDLGEAFSAEGDNFFAIKVTYWLPL